MKKIYEKATGKGLLGLKIWLSIICSLSAVLMLVCMLGTVLLAEYGVYNGHERRIAEDLNQRAGEAYALWAIASWHGGELYNDIDLNLEGTGFKYGIIKGKSKQISANTSYADKNFAGELPEDYEIRTFTLGERPVYYLSDRLLEDNSYDSDADMEYTNLNVKGIGYDDIDDTVYIWDGEQFYKIFDEFAYAIEEGNYDSSDDGEVNNAYSLLWKNSKVDVSRTDYNYTYNEEDTSEEQTYVVEDSEDDTASTTEQTVEYLPSEVITTSEGMLYMGDRSFPSMAECNWNKVLYISAWSEDGPVLAENVADLSGIHDELCDLTTHRAELKSATTARVETESANTTKYTVVYYNDGENAHDSLYAQAARYAGMVPTLKNLLPLGMVLFFAVALWMLVLLMTTAGHRVETEGITAGWLDRIPMDLMFIIAFVLECIPVAVIGIVVDGMDNRQHPVFTITVVAIAAFAFCLIGLRWLMTVAVNVKLGHWWHNTLIYKLFHVIKAWWGRTRLDIRAIRRTIRWDIRIWILFGVFVLFELFGLIVFDARGDLVLVWFCEKVLFGFLLFQILKHYAKLKNSVVQMAEGDMNVQIDTKGMPLDFEEHGEALNKISSGMTTAVTERIKSERMKTELITNVSHDIKTPLTSIINYVDLLQKEQIENDKAKEYLEVLDRQAKRLKKLIEDLIEASKAATGNIKFQMESVNARMILNQSIGEFEERLEQNDITVVSKVPEEDVYVWADNRYLWRVFDNLMNNIVKYAQPGTRAYVDMIKADGTITFTFRNTSKNELNISAEELMERFVRGDASRNTEGNGLGLSIARSLTESMDGKMDLAIDGDLFKVILTFKAQ